MQKKVWIGLEGMEFYAHHGVYEQEKITGTTFSVDVKVYADAVEACLYDELSGTVNYEILYDIVKKRMQTPVKLLEHLAHLIVEDIGQQLPKVEKAYIKIQKMPPPLGTQIKSSVVEYECLLR